MDSDMLVAIETILLICTIGILIFNYLSYKREGKRVASTVNEERKKGESERKTTRQLLDYINTLRTDVEENRKAVKRLEQVIENRLTPSSATAIQDKQQILKEEALRLKKEQLEWNKLKGVAKGIGWVLDRMKETDED